MNCPDESILSSFVNCTLSQTMSDELETHLAECPECRRKVSELERTQPLEFVLPDDPVSAISGLNTVQRHFEETLEKGEFLHLPQAVGPYLLTEMLGQGGMGAVYAAEHQILQKKFAVKFIRPKFLLNSESLKRFQKEILAAGKLVHPNIVLATDAGVFENTPFLVMEFLEGETLSAYVREKGGRLPLREALNILSQAACGLEFAHSAGLIHCDVKPSNLWRLPDGTIKIMDLGLASAAEEFEGLAVHPILGTPNFMAPEQSIPQAKVDSRSDIYALGCVFFFLLTGLTQNDCVCRGIEFPNLKEAGVSVPRKVQRFLDLMTKTAAARRISSMAAVRQTLKELQKPFWKTPEFAMEILAILLGISLIGLCMPGFRTPTKRTQAERSEPPVSSDEGSIQLQGPDWKVEGPPSQMEEPVPDANGQSMMPVQTPFSDANGQSMMPVQTPVPDANGQSMMPVQTPVPDANRQSMMPVQTPVPDANGQSLQTEEGVEKNEEEEKGLSQSIKRNAEDETLVQRAEDSEYSTENEQRSKTPEGQKSPKGGKETETPKTRKDPAPKRAKRGSMAVPEEPKDAETVHFEQYFQKIDKESKRFEEIQKEQMEYEKMLENPSDTNDFFPYRDVPKVKMENSEEIPEINWEEKRKAISSVRHVEEADKEKAAAICRSGENIVNRLFMTMDMNKGKNFLDAETLEQFAEPIRRFEKALEMGSEDAIYNLWDLYWVGIYVPESPEDLYQRLLESARNGNIGAIHSVGLECWFGRFHERAPEKAVQWFWNAVTSNLQDEQVHECLLYLGQAYDLGEGVPRSHQNALICYECATTSGNAICEIGISYLTGNGYRKDPEKAFMIFLSCVSKSVKSEYMLGYCLENNQEYKLRIGEEMTETDRLEMVKGLYREAILCDQVMMALGFQSCFTPELLEEFPSSLFLQAKKTVTAE